MGQLKGFQKRFLRSLAHPLKPVVFVGQKGLSATLTDAIDDALERHELIKVKFVDFKEKALKSSLAEQIEASVTCEMVGMVGHMVIYYRRQKDPEKRKITLPQRSDA